MQPTVAANATALAYHAIRPNDAASSDYCACANDCMRRYGDTGCQNRRWIDMRRRMYSRINRQAMGEQLRGSGISQVGIVGEQARHRTVSRMLRAQHYRSGAGITQIGAVTGVVIKAELRGSAAASVAIPLRASLVATPCNSSPNSAASDCRVKAFVMAT